MIFSLCNLGLRDRTFARYFGNALAPLYTFKKLLGYYLEPDFFPIFTGPSCADRVHRLETRRRNRYCAVCADTSLTPDGWQATHATTLGKDSIADKWNLVIPFPLSLFLSFVRRYCQRKIIEREQRGEGEGGKREIERRNIGLAICGWAAGHDAIVCKRRFGATSTRADVARRISNTKPRSKYRVRIAPFNPEKRWTCPIPSKRASIHRKKFLFLYSYFKLFPFANIKLFPLTNISF